MNGDKNLKRQFDDFSDGSVHQEPIIIDPDISRKIGEMTSEMKKFFYNPNKKIYITKFQKRMEKRKKRHYFSRGSKGNFCRYPWGIADNIPKDITKGIEDSISIRFNLMELPLDIIKEVLRFMPQSALHKMRRTCKFMNDMILNETRLLSLKWIMIVKDSGFGEKENSEEKEQFEQKKEQISKWISLGRNFKIYAFLNLKKIGDFFPPEFKGKIENIPRSKFLYQVKV